ncbi:metallophosphoesterase [Enemella evansiae]|uniref:metallophosphoesterase n=1 Tax=Enemella evansiae TaxID=2016499 RepID=UPI000B960A22|nr:metallophosphoesterase [Enemella evansiae]OYN98548.1 metallophosphoesterase [Enemella evansiae]
MSNLTRAGVGVLAAGAACVGYGALVESRAYTLREFGVPVLPIGADPVRVLHVSDLHLLPGQQKKVDWVRSLAGLRPDLVVNTGDNHSHPDAWPRVLEAYEPLLGVPGVFVWGSNDYLAPKMKNPLSYFSGPSDPVQPESAPDRELPWRTLGAAFAQAGWQDLTHRAVTLPVKGMPFAFRGTDDGHLGRARYAEVAGPADPDAVLNLGVTHAPYLRLLDAFATDRMDLILAGHTHGGQVCLPGIGALVTNCDIDAPRVKGLSTHTAGGHTSALHVSAGLGTSPFAPYRFACRPEATLLTLLPRG